jgi:hypothetical protein
VAEVTICVTLFEALVPNVLFLHVTLAVNDPAVGVVKFGLSYAIALLERVPELPSDPVYETVHESAFEELMLKEYGTFTAVEALDWLRFIVGTIAVTVCVADALPEPPAPVHDAVAVYVPTTVFVKLYVLDVGPLEREPLPVGPEYETSQDVARKDESVIVYEVPETALPAEGLRLTVGGGVVTGGVHVG